MQKNEEYYFEKAPVSEAIAHMAIPMMLGMCINTIYSITDAFLIGLLNHTEMQAAVALALPFTTILMAIGNIFGIGGGTFISRLLGEKAHDKAKVVSSVSFYFSLISGFVFMFLIVPALNPILSILGTDGSTLQFTKDVIIIFTLGSPLVIANFTLEQVVRAEGASVISMKGMLISVLVNITLDPFLIFGLHLNVVGASLGTIIANAVAVIYYVYFLEKKSQTLSGFLRKFNPNRYISKDIVKIGISAFILDAFLIVSSLVLNNFSVAYGDFVVAGFSISQRIVQISEFIAMGLCIGIVPLTAYAYSSKNIQRMKNIIRTTAKYTATLISTISIIMFVFRTEIIQLFSRDPNVVNIGTYILSATLISSIFAGFSTLFIGTFQAVGKGKEATIMSVIHGALFTPIIFLGNNTFGLHGIIWALTITEILTCTIGGILYFHLKKKIAIDKTTHP